MADELKKLPSYVLRKCESDLRRLADEVYVRYHAEEIMRALLSIRKRTRNVRRYIQKIE